jgi:hypothetical protein
MKYLEEIYGLFVDDPWLALIALLGLGLAAVVARGSGAAAALVLIIVVVGGLIWSVGRG